MNTSKITGRSSRRQHFLDLNSSTELNLVSLMDIFTILVFFLLVSSNTQQLPSSKDIKLPTSVSQKVPKETLIIAITKDSILVHGRQVAKLDEVLASDDAKIAALEKELKFQASKLILTESTESPQLAVTIMGDESIPYKLVRKILTTCRDANYTQIAFAALQKSRSKT